MDDKNRSWEMEKISLRAHCHTVKEKKRAKCGQMGRK